MRLRYVFLAKRLRQARGAQVVFRYVRAESNGSPSTQITWFHSEVLANRDWNLYPASGWYSTVTYKSTARAAQERRSSD